MKLTPNRGRSMSAQNEIRLMAGGNDSRWM